jgi:hypothetical protein
MKKIIVGFSVLLGLMGAQALAADLPLRSPPPVAPLFTWTAAGDARPPLLRSLPRGFLLQVIPAA